MDAVATQYLPGFKLPGISIAATTKWRDLPLVHEVGSDF